MSNSVANHQFSNQSPTAPKIMLEMDETENITLDGKVYTALKYRTTQPIQFPSNPRPNRLKIATIELSGPVLGVPGVKPKPAMSTLFVQDNMGKYNYYNHWTTLLHA